MAHRLLGAERRPLKRGRQESGAPVVRTILRHAARIGNRDERGQVLVLAAERIADPRAEAGKTIEHEAGREEVFGRAVRVGLAGERMDERNVVGQLREMRDHVGNHLAGLAARAELVLRPGKISGRSLERHRRTAGQRLAVPLDQLGLVVPRFQLAHGSAQKMTTTFFAFGGKCGGRGA